MENSACNGCQEKGRTAGEKRSLRIDSFLTDNKSWHCYGEKLLSGSCAKWLRSVGGIGNARNGKMRVDDFDKNRRRAATISKLDTALELRIALRKTLTWVRYDCDNSSPNKRKIVNLYRRFLNSKPHECQ